MVLYSGDVSEGENRAGLMYGQGVATGKRQRFRMGLILYQNIGCQFRHFVWIPISSYPQDAAFFGSC